MVVDLDKKERLRRLAELNMRSLGVTSFEAPVAVSRESEMRELLKAVRDRKSMICHRQGMTGQAGHDRRAWAWKYRNL